MGRIRYSEYVEAFSDTRLTLKASDEIPNFEPQDDIWPTDRAPVLRMEDGGVELAQLSWGFAPGRPKAGPAINFRSEGRRFTHGRYLVPASFFFEFTGSKSPKNKWRFTKTGEDWFCFAGCGDPRRARCPKPLRCSRRRRGPMSPHFTTGKWWCWSKRIGLLGWSCRSRRRSCCVLYPQVVCMSNRCGKPTIINPSSAGQDTPTLPPHGLIWPQDG